MKTRKRKYKKQKAGNSVNRVNGRFTPKTNEELFIAMREYFNPENSLAETTYGTINSWNVSLITDMSHLFADLPDFNEDISGWDVSNVTDMSSMFEECSKFNQPLNDWNVSNVINMSSMFYKCSNFNQPLNDWDVSNVTDMNNMFYGCSNFNQPLNDWDVSNVTNMSLMFEECSKFNQPLNDWNVSNVTDMYNIFYKCSNFNQPLNNWDVFNVTDMSSMFEECSKFNQPLNDWNVSNVINMSSMFYKCSNFNQPLNNWDVSNVTDMASMFFGCSNFNQPLNDWDVSNVTDMESMFEGCRSLNQDFSNWNINPATANATNMFNGTQFQIQQVEADPIPIQQNTTDTIDYTKTSMDIITGEDITVDNYLKEDPDNVVFILNGFYYYSTFSTIDHLLKDENVMKYPCFNIGTSIVPRRENVDLNRPIFPLKSIGMHSGYILLSNVIWMLKNKNKRAFVLTEKEKIPSVVSKQMMGPNPNAVSATHCQEGHSDTIYNISWLDTSIAVGGKIKTRKIKTGKIKTRKIKTGKIKTRKNRRFT